MKGVKNLDPCAYGPLGIILMGAFLEPADVPRAAALGAAFLTKPFELARMRALVRALVATPSARAADLVEAAGG